MFFMDLYILTQIHGVFHRPAYTYTGPWCFHGSAYTYTIHMSMVFFIDLHIPTQVHGVFMDLHILIRYKCPWCFSWTYIYLHRSMVFSWICIYLYDTHVHGVFHRPAYTYTGPWCFHGSAYTYTIHMSMVFFMDLHIPTQVHGVFMDLHILIRYTCPWCFSWTYIYLHRSMVLFLGQDISVDVSETQTAWTDMFYSVMRQLSDP